MHIENVSKLTQKYSRLVIISSDEKKKFKKSQGNTNAIASTIIILACFSFKKK